MEFEYQGWPDYVSWCCYYWFVGWKQQQSYQKPQRWNHWRRRHSYSHSGTKSSGVVQPESGERLNIYAMAGSNPGLLRTWKKGRGYLKKCETVSKDKGLSKGILGDAWKKILWTSCKIRFLYGYRAEHRCRILRNHFGGNATEIKNTYTKWLDDGRFFLLPKAIFTLGISPGEMKVYAHLVFCENRETYQCWPSICRISQNTGMSTNTVAKYIRQLEEKWLINIETTKVRTKTGKVRNGTLRFAIRPIQEAVDYKLERDLAALPEQKHTRKKKRNRNEFWGPGREQPRQGRRWPLLSQRMPRVRQRKKFPGESFERRKSEK